VREGAAGEQVLVRDAARVSGVSAGEQMDIAGLTDDASDTTAARAPSWATSVIMINVRGRISALRTVTPPPAHVARGFRIASQVGGGRRSVLVSNLARAYGLLVLGVVRGAALAYGLLVLGVVRGVVRRVTRAAPVLTPVLRAAINGKCI
jgi:hypothetical protein